jgi:hypothetical protein
LFSTLQCNKKQQANNNGICAHQLAAGRRNSPSIATSPAVKIAGTCRRKFHGVVGTSKRATRAAGTFDSSAVKNSRF